MQEAERDRTVMSQKPAETRPDAKSALSRRALLRSSGSVAAAATVASLLSQPVGLAQETAPPHPAMRSPQSQLLGAATAQPDVPPLPVIVFNRLAFGPRPGDWNAFKKLGANNQERLQAYVEQQLNPDSIDDSACDSIIESYGFTTLNKKLATLWADHVNGEGGRYLPFDETVPATFLRAIYSERQLVEILADHWHNHFNIFGRDYWSAPVWVHYDRDVIRGNLLGNFRKMLEAVGRSPAMLYYLDNQSNSGDRPNENYARELFELHAMGAENYLGVRDPEDPTLLDEQGNRLGYIDEDVYGATTCFTGWRVNTDTGLFEFDESKHFPYQKFVLGSRIPSSQGIQDGKDVYDLLVSQPGSARYICRRLCRRLIADNPPESVVQAAADVFMGNLNHPEQLKQVVRTIILSPEFSNTWGQKIKRPFEYSVGILRATRANFEPSSQFNWSYNAMGQQLFHWRPPNGYPDDKESWSSTMPMLQRWRHANWLFGWKIGGEGEDKDVLRLQVEKQMPASVNTPNAIVNFWINRILGRAMPDNERQPIVEFMAHGRNPDFELPADQIESRMRHMIALIFMSPSYQWR